MILTEKANFKKGLLFIVLIPGLLLSCYVLLRGYKINSSILFYIGLLLTLIISVICKFIYKNNVFLQNISNMAILSIILFSIIELIFFKAPEGRVDIHQLQKDKVYSFETAKGNPKLFHKWWNNYVKEWYNLKHHIEMPDPNNILPFKLKPNSSVIFFSGSIKINSHGFRGKEFNIDKGDNYRIVAIGESTTMGATINKEDLPWPKVLEHLINSQLRCNKKIEVINAGIEAFNLEDNIYRVTQDVLPLKPDMIISYHGYNGFKFIIDSMPAIRASDPPSLRARPSFFLAKLEFRLKLWNFMRKHFHQQDSVAILQSKYREDVLNTKYAELYKHLISISKRNGFILVLLNFNMAVNQNSPVDVINFYAGGFPSVRSVIIANLLHTRLIEQLTRNERNVLYIDTSPELDGYYNKYIDLVHFTQEGRNKLAKNIFNGIKSILMQEKKLQGQ